IRITSGPALERAGDLAAMLSNLVEGDVLFIDEIHRMARPAEEMLYLAMEDFRVDVVVGKGPGATSIPLDIAPFTLVGATTRSGVLTGPLRDRFGFTAHMEFYEPHELEQVVTRSAAILGVDLRPFVPGDRARIRCHHQGSGRPGARADHRGGGPGVRAPTRRAVPGRDRPGG
ncbi:AAA family ATPase, partial [Kibdelosporangium lantanae]